MPKTLVYLHVVVEQLLIHRLLKWIIITWRILQGNTSVRGEFEEEREGGRHPDRKFGDLLPNHKVHNPQMYRSFDHLGRPCHLVSCDSECNFLYSPTLGAHHTHYSGYSSATTPCPTSAPCCSTCDHSVSIVNFREEDNVSLFKAWFDDFMEIDWTPILSVIVRCIAWET